eukprot:g9558.t1
MAVSFVWLNHAQPHKEPSPDVLKQIFLLGFHCFRPRCSLCREVFYCGRDCQKRDLRRHRQQDGCISNHCAGKRSPPTELREASCKWKGDTFKVKVEFEATVADLKKHIFAKHKELPVDQQMLFYSENVLDGQTPIKERASQRPAGPARTKRSETETSCQILAKPGS